MENYLKPHIYRQQIVATGKFYIGKHKGGDKYYKGSGIEYKKDLKKYKKIKTEILEYIDDISELNRREEYWLEKFDAANNPLYYNKTNKSYGPVSQTDEWKNIQSSRMKGKSTTKGKTWDVSDTSNYKGGNFKGKKHSEETINKLKNHPTRNKNISKSLKGRNISEWKDKIYTAERNNKISQSKGKGIVQLDLDGNLIKEWTSFGEVIKNGYPGVSGAIRREKEYKGYIWKRKKDFVNYK
jgi:hypothetical protein